MEIWQAIILGAVQGFAEFLPISSSGHLFLLSNWFGIKENVIFYSVMLHIGTLIPVISVLNKQILNLFKSPFKNLKCLLLATIPAGVIGVLLSKVFDIGVIFEQNGYLFSLTFLTTAIFLIYCEKRNKNVLNKSINYKSAFIMGVGQAIGVLPGISRSGATITAGNFAGINREDNANFTFLMSIPIILSAVLLEGASMVSTNAILQINILAVLFGIFTSAVCGYLAITCMLKVIKKASYKWFSLYLIALSLANLICYFI